MSWTDAFAINSDGSLSLTDTLDADDDDLINGRVIVRVQALKDADGVCLEDPNSDLTR